MRTTRRTMALVAFLAIGVAGCGDSGSSNGPLPAFTEVAFALSTDGTDLLRLEGDSQTRTAITGLNAGTALLGIDYRPSNGLLYALGSDGQLYTLGANGAAAAVGGPQVYGDMSEGIAFDFNAQPDAIRVVMTADGRNFVTNTATGVPAEFTTTAYNAADPNAGKPPFVVATAYTNNVAPFPAGGTTIQYSLEAEAGVLAVQGKNAGTLDTVVFLNVFLGSAAVGGVAGFDISGETGIGYVVANHRLFSINLADGVLTELDADAEDVADATIVP